MDKYLIRELLDYDPQSGVFTHRKSGGRCKAGGRAGYTNAIGYVCIRFSDKLYSAHRLAFLWMDGEWPAGPVDHIDGNRSNNAWANLRVVDHQGNNRNKRRQHTNTSGRTGIYWDKDNSKWRAYIYVSNKRQLLGRFSRFEDACRARLDAEALHGFHPNHGRA